MSASIELAAAADEAAAGVEGVRVLRGPGATLRSAARLLPRPGQSRGEGPRSRVDVAPSGAIRVEVDIVVSAAVGAAVGAAEVAARIGTVPELARAAVLVRVAAIDGGDPPA